MKRFTLLIILFFSFVFVSAKNDDKSDAQQVKENISIPTIQSLGLNGKVKLYTLFNDTEYRDSLTESEHFFICRMSFDEEGNIVKIFSSEDTTQSSFSSFKYDERGNLLETCKYAEENVLKKKIVCQYSENGNLIYMESTIFEWYGKGNVQERSVSVFNENGTQKSQETSYYDNNGVLKKKFVYKYGKSGLVELNEYDAKNKLISRQKNVKMDNERELEMSNFYVLGKNRGFDKVAFDEEGNMTQRVREYLDRIERYSCQIEYYQ